VRLLPSSRCCQREAWRSYSISASSTQCEHNRSSLEQTITDVRSMLSSGRIEAVEIVRSAISTGLVDTHDT
jgi:hypothetical protein